MEKERNNDIKKRTMNKRERERENIYCEQEKHLILIDQRGIEIVKKT